MTARPLAGIRVLDLGQYLAGPLVGMMLADLGAEVIRIDPPGGPRLAGPVSEMLSRGKRSLEVDLKARPGREELLGLAARSDVLIENFRPGVMARLGVAPPALREANPTLVSLSMPGFASTDPAWEGIAAWEAVIAASVGQFTDMGLNRRLMKVNPSFTPLGLASAYAATFGAMAVLFALASRDVTGGDHIEVPLATALYEGLAYNAMQIEDYPDRYKSPRELELDRKERDGDDRALTFEELSDFLDPFYRTYRCADGRGFYVVSGSVARHPRRVLETLGLGELADQLPDFDPYLDSAEWPAGWSLRNYPVGPEDRARIASAMKEAFLTRPAHEWEELFGAAKAPATAQRTTAEWLHDPHALASGLVLDVRGTRFGAMKQMGNVAWLEGDRAAAAKGPGPELDDLRPDLEEILAEPPRDAPGSSGRADSSSGARRGWLDGLKVLDLTNVIAGPMIGSTLARFGAEVILVQPVVPSVDPWNTIVFGLQAQRGKRSALVDLTLPEGRQILDRLLADVDVVTYNGTEGQAVRLGLDPDRLRAVNPDLLLVRLDAFGGPAPGPKSEHLGYDDLAQAATGVMVRFGGGMDTPEEHAHFGTIDVLAGYCACVAFGAALVQKRRTGATSVARASLAAGGNLIQAQFMYDYEGRGPFDEPAGREARGWSPSYQAYEAADGWLFYAGPSAGAPPSEDDFRRHDVARWTERLRGTAAAAVPLGSLHATREASLRLDSDGERRSDGATFHTTRYDHHPMGRWCDLVAPTAVRPRRARIRVPGPAPKYGDHTRTILAELGYSAATIDDLIQRGVVGESWSKRYLPD